jgi:hypothetical protein
MGLSFANCRAVGPVYTRRVGFPGLWPGLGKRLGLWPKETHVLLSLGQRVLNPLLGF